MPDAVLSDEQIAEIEARELREPGNFDLYRKQGQQWICTTCGSEIKAVIRRVSVWDGPGPCAGFGEVETFQEPYCPQCEEKPHG